MEQKKPEFIETNQHGYTYRIKKIIMEPEKYTIQEIVDAIKAAYSREFGKLDDRAYFMTGFILTCGIESYIHEQRNRPMAFLDDAVK